MSRRCPTRVSVGSARGERAAEMRPDPLDGLGVEPSRPRGEMGDRLRTVDNDRADLDLSEPGQALDPRKTQRTDDVELVSEVEVGERGADVADLLLDAGDELRL